MKQSNSPSKSQLNALLNAFIFLLITLSSCGSGAADEKQISSQTEKADSNVSVSAKTIDSLISYESLDFDTNYSELKRALNEDNFHFFFYEYSLNDSGVFQEKKQFNKNNELVFKNINYFHNREIHFYVLKNQKPFFDKIIHKDLFKPVIEEWQFNKIKLFDIQFHHYKNGVLFFSTTFMSADTSIITEVKFSIKDSPQKINNEIKIINPNDYFESNTNPEVFYLSSFQINKNNKIGFISFSDNYVLSEHPDSLAIQTNAETKYNNNKYFKEEYIKLDNKHRKLFLSKLKISENDSLFIYEYGMDTLISLKVNKLNVVACLNVYRQGDQNESDFEGFDQYDYMIGFEVEPSILNRLGDKYYQSFVCVGKVNSFLKNQLKPLVWTNIKSSEYPNKGISTENDLLTKRCINASDSNYKYINSTHSYYVKDIFMKNYNYVTKLRRLIIIENKSNEVVLDELFDEGESTSTAPLNNAINKEGDFIYQWTGKLFKNKPPVVFGFNFESFGCPHISILDLSERSIYLRCDNRH